jgi:hypothetical protein
MTSKYKTNRIKNHQPRLQRSACGVEGAVSDTEAAQDAVPPYGEGLESRVDPFLMVLPGRTCVTSSTF